MGDKFINNMDLVKNIQIDTNSTNYEGGIIHVTLQYAKKCCKEAYNCMSKINAKIYPELANKVFELLRTKNCDQILPFNDNDCDYVFKKEDLTKQNTFEFNWDMDELTNTTWDTQWDIDWNFEEDYQQEIEIDSTDAIYESDEEYEDTNKRMVFKNYISYRQ